MIIEKNIQHLQQLEEFLLKIDTKNYSRVSQLLNEASIGKHIRHILEYYICLMNQGVIINYDLRPRNTLIETNPLVAIKSIHEIIVYLRSAAESLQVFIYANDRQLPIRSFLAREILYCYEHSIHHQAMIKIALIEFNLGHFIEEDLGVAPSTLAYRSSNNSIATEKNTAY